MNKSTIPYQLAHKIGISLTMGSLAWVALLIQGALAFRDQGGHWHDVAIGPLTLTRLHRDATSDGVTVGFTFESGLPWYLLCCVIAGALWGLISAYVRRSDNRTD